MERRRIFRPLLSLALSASLMLHACMEQNLESKRLDRNIDIDGKAPEWAGLEAYYDAKNGFKIGFLNDDRYLYLFIAIWNKSTQRHILMNGLRVKFQGPGKSDGFLEISYPIGNFRAKSQEKGTSLRSMPSSDQDEKRKWDATKRPFQAPDSAAGLFRIDIASREALIKSDRAADSMLVFVPEDSSRTGIMAMLRSSGRLLIIEMRVPLEGEGNDPFAILAKGGDIVRIDFESGSNEDPGTFGRKGPQGMNPPDGDFRPGGGFGQPGGMNPGMRGAIDSAKGINLRTRVKLAQQDLL